MLRRIVPALALLAAATPLAPSAAATYPHLAEPFTWTIVVPGFDFDTDFDGYNIPGADFDEACLHRDVFCAGPIHVEGQDIPGWGDRWVWVGSSGATISVTYNESHMAETGPWIIDSNYGSSTLCAHKCLWPMWVNATVHGSAMVMYYDEGRVTNVMPIVHADTWELMHPYVRPYDPSDPDGYPRTEPRDAYADARDIVLP